ncbi:MAG: hypothetical protein ACK481_10145 [Candidatus Melainabacteria bacterium]|jgi:hypothetical protein
MPNKPKNAGKKHKKHELETIEEAHLKDKGPDYVQGKGVKRSEDAIVAKSKKMGYPLKNT